MYEDFDLETFEPTYEEVAAKCEEITLQDRIFCTNILTDIIKTDIANKIYVEFQRVIANAKNLNDSKSTKILREIQAILVEHNNDEGRKHYAKHLNRIIDVFIDNAVFAGINTGEEIGND